MRFRRETVESAFSNSQRSRFPVLFSTGVESAFSNSQRSRFPVLSSTGASDSPPAGEFPAGTAAGAGVPAPAASATTLSIYAFSRFRSVSFCCAISSSSRCTPSAARSFGMLVSREMLRSCSNECCVYSSALLPQTGAPHMRRAAGADVNAVNRHNADRPREFFLAAV